MGDMKDQYDDGRYDGVPDEVQYRDGHYYVELPGGWCVPAEQRVGWPFNHSVTAVSPDWPFNDLDRLITPIRGGMKYPTPGVPAESSVDRAARHYGLNPAAYPTPTKLKGTTVAQSVTQKLAALKTQQDLIAKQIASLENAIKRPLPPSNQSAWTIEVRFTPGGKLYNYLILRVGGVFYTTGQGDDSKFYSWDGVLRWLDEMDSHSALIPLRADFSKAAPLEGRQ